MNPRPGRRRIQYYRALSAGGYGFWLVTGSPFVSPLAVPRWFRFPFPPFRDPCWFSSPNEAADSFILIVGSRWVLVLAFRACLDFDRARWFCFSFVGTAYWSTRAKNF